MPKRQDIKSILIIGAGPIVIGQACEFDYSGTQACKALKEEGYRVILVNSNPATIMTDPGLADATYVEPITPEVVAKIIAKERPDALLPTMGGQTALNTALSLKRMGVLDRYNVEMIGAKPAAIDKAEDRALFREAMEKIGLETPRSMLANATEWDFSAKVVPLVVGTIAFLAAALSLFNDLCRKPEAATRARCDVGEDVAERVLGQDHVELHGIEHELHPSIVDEHVLEPHVGVVACQAGDDLTPEP